MLHVGPEPIDPAAELAAFTAAAGSAGALVSFTGLVRPEGGAVEALELEHYPGFTEAQISSRLAEVERDFGLLSTRVVHRVGRIAAGEAVVFVAAAASHRRAAFEAVDCLMDYLKSAAPFWKKELTGAGGRWVEPRAQDRDDLSRWAGEAAE
jgi:molybdopterin synthase catalytic subunit